MDNPSTDLCKLFVAALNAIDEGILIIDSSGTVVFANHVYDQDRMSDTQIIGKALLSERPGAKLPEVMSTRVKQKHVLRQENAAPYVANMYPICDENDQLLGGISVGASLSNSLSNAEQIMRYQDRIHTLQRQLSDSHKAVVTFDQIVAQDVLSIQVKAAAQKAAESEVDVLLLGESGVGKEMYAQAIHNASPHKDAPFIAVNCASLQGNLLESELFGYENGAFTGAKPGGKTGLFEATKGGTLFLDEISELDYGLQARLLRVLQERQIRKVGGTKEIPIDVHLIAASNVDLEALIKKEMFRKDLYYRIAAFPIVIPPLHKRIGDILPLVRTFLIHYENKIKRRVDLDEEVKKCFLQYRWDGNVRQLKNAIIYATTMMTGPVIHKEDLPHWLSDSFIDTNRPISSLKSRIFEFEQEEIKRAVQVFGDDLEGKKQAATALGISLSTLYTKLQAVNGGEPPQP